jgi:hypothetical protein
VVIGGRALGHRARRKAGVTGTGQRTKRSKQLTGAYAGPDYFTLD